MHKQYKTRKKIMTEKNNENFTPMDHLQASDMRNLQLHQNFIGESYDEDLVKLQFCENNTDFDIGRFPSIASLDSSDLVRSSSSAPSGDSEYGSCSNNAIPNKPVEILSKPKLPQRNDSDHLIKMSSSEWIQYRLSVDEEDRGDQQQCDLINTFSSGTGIELDYPVSIYSQRGSESLSSSSFSSRYFNDMPTQASTYQPFTGNNRGAFDIASNQNDRFSELVQLAKDVRNKSKNNSSSPSQKFQKEDYNITSSDTKNNSKLPLQITSSMKSAATVPAAKINKKRNTCDKEEDEDDEAEEDEDKHSEHPFLLLQRAAAITEARDSGHNATSRRSTPNREYSDQESDKQEKKKARDSRNSDGRNKHIKKKSNSRTRTSPSPPSSPSASGSRSSSTTGILSNTNSNSNTNSIPRKVSEEEEEDQLSRYQSRLDLRNQKNLTQLIMAADHEQYQQYENSIRQNQLNRLNQLLPTRPLPNSSNSSSRFLPNQPAYSSNNGANSSNGSSGLTVQETREAAEKGLFASLPLSWQLQLQMEFERQEQQRIQRHQHQQQQQQQQMQSAITTASLTSALSLNASQLKQPYSYPTNTSATTTNPILGLPIDLSRNHQDSLQYRVEVKKQQQQQHQSVSSKSSKVTRHLHQPTNQHLSRRYDTANSTNTAVNNDSTQRPEVTSNTTAAAANNNNNKTLSFSSKPLIDNIHKIDKRKLNSISYSQGQEKGNELSDSSKINQSGNSLFYEKKRQRQDHPPHPHPATTKSNSASLPYPPLESPSKGLYLHDQELQRALYLSRFHQNFGRSGDPPSSAPLPPSLAAVSAHREEVGNSSFLLPGGGPGNPPPPPSFFHPYMTFNQGSGSSSGRFPYPLSLLSVGAGLTTDYNVDASKLSEIEARRVEMSNRGKYRCGKCGQPKANHTCVYATFGEVRSIGTQIERIFSSTLAHVRTRVLIVRNRDSIRNDRSSSSTASVALSTPASIPSSTSTNSSPSEVKLEPLNNADKISSEDRVPTNSEVTPVVVDVVLTTEEVAQASTSTSSIKVESVDSSNGGNGSQEGGVTVVHAPPAADSLRQISIIATNTASSTNSFLTVPTVPPVNTSENAAATVTATHPPAQSADLATETATHPPAQSADLPVVQSISASLCEKEGILPSASNKFQNNINGEDPPPLLTPPPPPPPPPPLFPPMSVSLPVPAITTSLGSNIASTTTSSYYS